MNIIHTKNFDSTFKKLKKHNLEYNNLLKLPQSRMYGLERMKHDKSDFYSFNLSKKGGVIRLIIKPDENNDIILYLITISYNHYKDFNPRSVIFYE